MQTQQNNKSTSNTGEINANEIIIMNKMKDNWQVQLLLPRFAAAAAEYSRMQLNMS